MSLFRGLFGDTAKRSSSAHFVKALMEDPPAPDVAWLCQVTTGDDEDRALWELRYLKRAAGLLAAERDALDDRTASSVAHELTQQMAGDRNVAAPLLRLAERQFNERLSAYRDMMAVRGVHASVTERVGRTLLLMAGAGRVGPEDVTAAAALADRYLTAAAESLRSCFGVSTPPGGPGRPERA